ncbi:MAG: hypothetical protein ACKODA_04395 [Nevskiaceae bacterium]
MNRSQRLWLLALLLAIGLRVVIDCHAPSATRTGIDALIAASLCTTDPDRRVPSRPESTEPPLCLHCTTGCNAKLPPTSRSVLAVRQADPTALRSGSLHQLTASSSVTSPPARGPPGVV